MNDEVEARVQTIMDAMRTLKWRRGKSGPEYAKQWGLHPQRVGELAAEASRRLRAEFEDPDRATVSVFTTLETVMHDGATSIAPGEKAAAVQAARLFSELAGLGVDKKAKAEPIKHSVVIEYARADPDSAERSTDQGPPSAPAR